MILLYHSKEFKGSGGRYLGTGNYIGVEFFFIVSGFYLARAALRQERDSQTGLNGNADVGLDTLHYMGSRLNRIYPEFLVAMAIALTARVAVLGWPLKKLLHMVGRSIGEWTMLQQTGYNTGRWLAQPGTCLR